MNSEKLERDLLDKCVRLEGLDESEQKKEVTDVLAHLEKEWSVDISQIGGHELKALSSSIISQATRSLTDELESLLLQKERIERQLDKKTHELQSHKHRLFSLIEESIKEKGASTETIHRLHSLEIQSMDLLTLL